MTINQILKIYPPDKYYVTVVIDCPNRMEVYPQIKMRFDRPSDMFFTSPDKMIITWEQLLKL